MKRSDRITAVVVLTALALVVVAWVVMHRTPGTVAVVRVDGGGSIRVAEATCADQICVHTVAARSPGDQIICVPNRMVIMVEGKGTGIDALAQ
jgi:hypothetical protein